MTNEQIAAYTINVRTELTERINKAHAQREKYGAEMREMDIAIEVVRVVTGFTEEGRVVIARLFKSKANVMEEYIKHDIAFENARNEWFAFEKAERRAK